MKFNLNAFEQLDTKQLLAVNGGSPCSGPSYTIVCTPGAGDPSGDSSPSGGHSWTDSGSGSKNTGGSCTNPDDNKGKDPSNKDPSNENEENNGGGGCSNPPSSKESPKVIVWGDHTIIINSGDSYEERNDGSIKVTREDGSHDYYYENGGSQHYPAGTPTSTNNPSTPPTTQDNGGSTGSNTSGDGDTVSGTGTIEQGNSSPSDGSGSSSGSPSNPSNPQNPNTPGQTVVQTSGTFGQITDGSYADKLTMQYYKNKYKEAKSDQEITQIFNDDNAMNGEGNIFSKKGCLMTAVAKIASEVSGAEIDLKDDINQKVDTDKDGKLSVNEISKGLNDILDSLMGDVYDVSVKNIEKVKLSDLENNVNTDANSTTYVLGFAPDCYGGHWVVLEGYSVDSTGKVTFSYDGTSDNDSGRSYILGTTNQDTNNRVYGINRIETVTITGKNN